MNPMKTTTKPLPPPTEADNYLLPSRDEHSLRVRFICAALSGLCANPECHGAADYFLVEKAFDLGELALDRYIEENNELLSNLSAVKKFNQKVGL